MTATTATTTWPSSSVPSVRATATRRAVKAEWIGDRIQGAQVNAVKG